MGIPDEDLPPLLPKIAMNVDVTEHAVRTLRQAADTVAEATRARSKAAAVAKQDFSGRYAKGFDSQLEYLAVLAHRIRDALLRVASGIEGAMERAGDENRRIDRENDARVIRRNAIRRGR